MDPPKERRVKKKFLDIRVQPWEESHRSKNSIVQYVPKFID